MQPEMLRVAHYLLLYSLRTVRRVPQPHALPAPVSRAGERRGEAAHLVRVRVRVRIRVRVRVRVRFRFRVKVSSRASRRGAHLGGDNR